MNYLARAWVALRLTCHVHHLLSYLLLPRCQAYTAIPSPNYVALLLLLVCSDLHHLSLISIPSICHVIITRSLSATYPSPGIRQMVPYLVLLYPSSPMSSNFGRFVDSCGVCGNE
ncbi:hypothetical protein BJV78DRAFT_1176307 [Lactifluus subvellereus]|nr:hypothetical protein BJV78DRAFT_1176307 [Lactifluus subvellereus]